MLTEKISQRYVELDSWSSGEMIAAMYESQLAAAAAVRGALDAIVAAVDAAVPMLRQGGRIGISTGLRGDQTAMHRAVAAALAEPPFNRHPRPRETVAFRIDEREMRELLETAGFAPTLIEVRPTEQVHPSAEAALAFSEASSFGNVLAHIPEEMKPAARQAVLAKLASIATPQGIVHQGRRLVAVAQLR